MKEAAFIRQNKKRWLEIEHLISHLKSVKTDSLSDMYQEVLAHLAYAQSQYPQSHLTIYLNNLAKQLHEAIYTPRRTDLGYIKKLFSEELPHVIIDARYELLISLSALIIFTIIGVILSLIDEKNIIYTLGENYVNMTLENIKNGVPTDVYSREKETLSFLEIATNNIKVSFVMYAHGLIPLIGPLYFIMSNAVMLGEFQTLFFLHGVGLQSMSAIWIHGTMEISSLVVEGGAAIALGRGWLLPGTYTRIEALKQSGLRSIKILVTCIPLIITAALLEGFVTRHVEWPLLPKLLIMIASLSFMIYVYVYIPYKLYQRTKAQQA